MLTALILSVLALLQSSVPAAPAVIMLDFVATGRDGQPVTDLAMADVSLKIGGKQRPLRSLDLVIPAEGGRTILVLADEGLYGLVPVANEAMAKLVASLTPADRIGYLGARSTHLSPPSTEHQLLTKAADAMVTGPGAPPLVPLRYPANHPGHGAKPAMRRVGETISAAQINVHLMTVSDSTRSWALDTRPQYGQAYRTRELGEYRQPGGRRGSAGQLLPGDKCRWNSRTEWPLDSHCLLGHSTCQGLP